MIPYGIKGKGTDIPMEITARRPDGNKINESYLKSFVWAAWDVPKDAEGWNEGERGRYSN